MSCTRALRTLNRQSSLTKLTAKKNLKKKLCGLPSIHGISETRNQNREPFGVHGQHRLLLPEKSSRGILLLPGLWREEANKRRMRAVHVMSELERVLWS